MLRTHDFRHRPIALRNRLAAQPRVEELEARLVLSLPVPDHVVLLIEENQSYSDIIGSPDAPYVNSLAQSGALFTQSYGIEHPSQPNYLDLFSGSNQGVTANNCPVGPFHTPDLGGELTAAGLSFAGYHESLPKVGDTTCFASNYYTRTTNPLPDFSDVPSNDNKPFAGYFPTNFTTLPRVALVVPNLADDMHDPEGSVAKGDTWLKNNLQGYINWTFQHNSLFILTFDEDDYGGNNRIPTIFVGSMVQPGQYSETINHYSVLRTLEDMYGLPHAGHSADVNPIADVWVGASTHFAVTTGAANPDVAGTPFDVTVTAQDANGNTVTGYTGTVHFSSGDPYGATLPADYTFTAGDGGTHTFTAGAKLYTAGTWDVTATDTVSAITGSAYVNVQAAPAVALQVVAPASAVSGQPFDVSVIAVDPYGNTDTNYAGTVTWTTTDGGPGVVLPADYTFKPSDQGRVTFPGGVTLITSGNQILTATDTVSHITGSATVTVTTAPSTGLGTFRNSVTFLIDPLSVDTLIADSDRLTSRVLPKNPGHGSAKVHWFTED